MKKKTAVILYSDAKLEEFPSKELYETEAEVYPRSKIVKKHIEKLGYEVTLLAGNEFIIEKLRKLKPDIVFNLVDSLHGKDDLCPVIPAMLEAVKLPYTGAGIGGLYMNADKHLTKMILKENGISVPDFQLFSTPDEPLNKDMEFPMIVKLNKFHGSVEITQDAVVENEKDLRKRIKYILDKYGGKVIVERYIKGTEITVMMVDGKEPLILGEERVMLRPQKYKMYGFEEAWSDEELYDVKKHPVGDRIKKEMIHAFRVLEMEDYARFEIIIDEEGRHYIIDANANPAFGPVEAGEAFGYLLHLYEIPFTEVAKTIIENAKKRYIAKKIRQ